jgi:uncharacterized protein YndB with AHSA1/START domain
MDRNADRNGWSWRNAGALRRARVFVAALLLAAWAHPAQAGDVAVEVEQHSGLYEIRGAFIVTAPAHVVWQVLTDYEHIGKFVRSVRSSTLERRADGTKVLRQAAVGGPFPFRRTMHVTLELREEPQRRIAFRDISGRDFRHYQGEWVVAVDSSVTSVAYALDARPRAAMPGMIGRGVLGGAAKQLLEQVRTEMLRRAMLASATVREVPAR